MFKLLMSFTGSDHYELLHSILTSNKHGPKYFINPDSEEINKAIIIAIARSISLISTNKDIDDSLKVSYFLLKSFLTVLFGGGGEFLVSSS